MRGRIFCGKPEAHFSGKCSNERKRDMDYRKKFLVEPGGKVRLAKIDPSYSGKHETHATSTPEIQKNVERMPKLQYLLYADCNQSLLSVLQPLTTPGTDQ